MVESQLRAPGHRRRARARRDGARSAGALRPRAVPRPGLRRRGAPDRRGPDDLAAVHGRADLRDARTARRRAGARRRHRLRLPGRRARRARRRGAHDRAASRRSPSARARRSPPPATSGSSSTSATGRSAPRSTRRSARSPSPRPRPSCRRRSTSSSSRGGRLVVPVGGPGGQELLLVVSEPRRAPPRARSVPCRFVPLVGAEGYSRRVIGYIRARGAFDRSWCRGRAGRPRAQASRRTGSSCSSSAVVGASGYVVNLAVYVALVKGADLHYLAGGGVLLRRRRDEQLLVEPALDLPRAAREHLLPGRSLSASSRRSRSG